MAVFTIQTPDGRRLDIEAADEATAIRGAKSWAAANPMRDVTPQPTASRPASATAQSPQQRARAAILTSQARDAAAGNDGKGKPFIQAATFNLMDELSGGKAALETGLANVGHRLKGEAAPYGMADAYEAGRDIFREQEAAERRGTSGGKLLFSELLGGAAGGAGAMKAGASAALRAPGMLTKVAQGAGIGAGYGAAAGAGGAKEGDRLKGATKGGVMGAGFGGALPVVGAGAGRALAPLGSAVARLQDVFDQVVGASPELLAARAAAASARGTAPELRAAQAIRNAVERDRAGGANLAPGAAPMYGGGENLQALFEVAAKSPGPARAIIRRAVLNQRGRTAAEVERDLGDSLGANGDFFATLDQRQIDRAKLSQEHFDKAFATPIDADLFNEKLAPLLARLPKGTQELAYDLARRDGRNPEELGLANIDSFDGFEVGGKTPLNLVSAEDLGALRRGSSPKVSQGPTLGEFLAKAGGINDLGGDLANIGARDWHRARPFLGRLLKETGMSPETAAQRAHEAGYFPDKFTPSMDSADNMHPVGPEDLLAAIQDEIAGRPRYAREADPAALARRGRLDDLEQQLRELGIDPRQTNQLAASQALTQRGDDLARLEAHADGPPLPMSPNEPVNVVNPTLETLHYIKMALDQGVEKYRNPVTGKLELEGQPEAVVDNKVRSELVRTLRGINGDYNTGMKIWGDETARRDALWLGRNVTSDKVDMAPERLAERVNDMSEAERGDFTKGVGEALLHQVRKAGGDIRVMRNLLRDRNLASKVALAFPDDEAFARFLQSADRRVTEADINSRYTGGSPTYPLAAARADLEAEGAHPLDLLGDAVTLDVKALGRRAVKAGLDAIPKRSRSAIGDPRANAALGRSAESADEVTRLLNMLERQRALSAVLAAGGAGLAPAASSVSGARSSR